MGAASGVNKVYADLNGSPVIVHSVNKFRTAGFIDAAVAVVAKRDEVLFDEIYNGASGAGHGSMPLYKTAGGAIRTESILNGLKRIVEIAGGETDKAVLIIHDGARPNFAAELLKPALEEFLAGASKDPLFAGLAFASPSHDTLCRVGEAGFIEGYEDRDKIYRVATPQIFSLGSITGCFEKLESSKLSGRLVFTDESSLALHFGYKVKIYRAPSDNLKITSPEDLDNLKSIMKTKSGVQ
jgi:2-C-methyl-D-erythritol 4-phosphate cytidylyltransferase